MRGRVGDVAGTGFALGPDHRRTLADAPQRLAEIGRPAHERHGEFPLVDVVGVVGRRQHLRLVDVVDTQTLQDLGLDEVSDARFGHHRDGDRVDDALDHVGVAHPRHPTLGSDIGGHPFQRHHRDGAGAFGDSGLFGGDDVHDDAALEHFGHAALDRAVPVWPPVGLTPGWVPFCWVSTTLLLSVTRVKCSYQSSGDPQPAFPAPPQRSLADTPGSRLTCHRLRGVGDREMPTDATWQ